MKVAVFGASGFVGTTVVERLLGQADTETRVCIHHVGNAWRLVRSQIPMTCVDILSSSQIAEVLQGCTHVVNCTRGSRSVMLAGLRNLLRQSKAAGIRRFVHLSSNAVYGNPPPPESEREDALPHPASGSYGWEKLRQDTMVEEASASGLDCVVLCPPNISGLYSTFVANVLQDIRNGSFALVDSGARPMSVVDVDNLVDATILALEIPRGDGRRIFVNDGVGLTWKNLADELLPLAEIEVPISNILESEVLESASAQEQVRKGSVWRSIKHLVSSDVREAIRRDPLWADIDVRIRKLVELSGKTIEDHLRADPERC